LYAAFVRMVGRGECTNPATLLMLPDRRRASECFAARWQDGEPTTPAMSKWQTIAWRCKRQPCRRAHLTLTGAQGGLGSGA
jgi:hypothetical protein